MYGEVFAVAVWNVKTVNGRRKQVVIVHILSKYRVNIVYLSEIVHQVLCNYQTWFWAEILVISLYSDNSR